MNCGETNAHKLLIKKKYIYLYYMDKFENEEKFGFYYESDQDSHLSDSDWVPSSPESFSSQESESDFSCPSSQEFESSQDSEESV